MSTRTHALHGKNIPGNQIPKRKRKKDTTEKHSLKKEYTSLLTFLQ